MPGRPRRSSPALVDAIIGVWRAFDRSVKQLRQATSAKTVHNCRIAARNFQVAARALRRKPIGLPTKRLSDTLKRLLRDLGPARDADVRMVTLRHVVSDPQLLASAAVEQRRRRRDLSNLTKTAGWTLRQDSIDRCSSILVEHLRSAPPSCEALSDILLRRDRSLRRHLSQNPSSSAKIHRLRLRVKELKVLLETFSPLCTDLDCIDLKLLARLQQRLGDFHDLWLAQQWMRAAIANDPAQRCAIGQPRLDKALRSAKARLRKRLIMANRSV